MYKPPNPPDKSFYADKPVKCIIRVTAEYYPIENTGSVNPIKLDQNTFLLDVDGSTLEDVKKIVEKVKNAWVEIRKQNS